MGGTPMAATVVGPLGVVAGIVGPAFVLWIATLLNDRLSTSATAATTITTTPGGGSEWNAGCAVLVYTAILLVTRTAEYGSIAVAEMLWGCNVALLMFSLGAMTGRPLLMGGASNIVAIDQLCWYVDALGFLFVRKFPVGVAKYLTWWDVPVAKKVTALHHLWFLPLCVVMVRRSGGLPMGHSWLLSCASTCVLAAISRACTPQDAVVPRTGKLMHLNINLSHAFWKDIDVGFLHIFDNAPACIFLPYLMVVCNLLLNGLPCLFLHWISTPGS